MANCSIVLSFTKSSKSFFSTGSLVGSKFSSADAGIKGSFSNLAIAVFFSFLSSPFSSVFSLNSPNNSLSSSIFSDSVSSNLILVSRASFESFSPSSSPLPYLFPNPSGHVS